MSYNNNSFLIGNDRQSWYSRPLECSVLRLGCRKSRIWAVRSVQNSNGEHRPSGTRIPTTKSARVLLMHFQCKQDSLLSRFDLLFIVLDVVDAETDRRIADHVVRMHRYRASNEQDGDPLPLAMNLDMLSTNNPDETEAIVQDTPIYEKYDALLHGSTRSKTDKIVSIQFMKKYIHVARAIKVSAWKLANNIWTRSHFNGSTSFTADTVARGS